VALKTHHRQEPKVSKLTIICPLRTRFFLHERVIIFFRLVLPVQKYVFAKPSQKYNFC
jgi:hypothetical protein